MMLRKGGHNDFSRYLLAVDAGGYGGASFSRFIRRIEVIGETDRSELADRMLGAGITPLRIVPGWRSFMRGTSPTSATASRWSESFARGLGHLNQTFQFSR